MKKYNKITGAILALVAFTIINTSNVMADGSVSITSDKDSCANGDSVSVTINAQADADSAIPPQLSVEFNSNRLSFEECSVEYGGGGGGLITINDTEATIKFTTLSGGDATIDVTAVLDEDSTDVQKASVTISVEGEDTAVGTDGGQESSTGVEEGTIDAGDGRVVQTVFADEFMPSLFYKSTTQYQGQTTECAQFSMGDMILLYTTDSQGADGKFSIYNAATGEMSDFRMIQGIENRFIIVLSECEGELPAGYTKAVLDWNGQTLTAYMNVEAANVGAAFGGISPSDFFLVYGLSSEGNKGWYQYDQTEGTYQRFLQLNGSTTALDADGSADGDTDASSDETFLDDYISGQVQMILLFVFLGLIIILFIVVIVLAVKNSEYSGYEYVDPDDYYGDDEGYEQPTYSRKTVTAASIVDESMNEDEEADEDEDDEDQLADNDEDDRIEEEEVEEEDYFDPRMSKKERKAYEKQLRREEKEAAREEKWRLKEEKKAAKMRNRGYEEASPMDWSSFSENMSQDDDRRPVGKSKLPKYMQDDEDNMPDMEEEIPEEIEAQNEEDEEVEEKLPPRKINPELSEQRAAESAKALKEDELRKKQKRLFEQQQRIEEQRRIEQEQYENEQKKEQQKFVLSQQNNEDLDEDFQFDFLDLN